MAKLPKKLQDILDAKEEYLNSNRDKLERSVISMQEKILNDIIKDVVSELDTDNGKIKQTTKNMRLINQLEETYAAFNKTVQLPVVQELGKGLLGINKFNIEYFTKMAIGVTTKERFNSIVNKTNDFMRTSIGVGKDGEINTGGFLDSFLTDRSLINDAKQLTIRAVTGQSSLADFKRELYDKVIGTEEKLGKFESYYKGFAYDAYSEYDNTYANNLAVEFKMNYAFYEGGLIKDSREFCKVHNGKVYSREEIMKFGSWKDSSGRVPSYIASFPGYNPLVNLGGFNCRHMLGWITDNIAFQLRPELKKTSK